MLLLYLFVNPC